MNEQIMSKLNVAEAAEICLRFRHDRNSDECICTYLGDAAELEASKHYPAIPAVLPPGYKPTNTRKIWKW